MDFSLNESERELVGLCRDFAQKEIATRAPLAWEEARCPTDLLREMGQLGLLGMLIPESGAGSACRPSASSPPWSRSAWPTSPWPRRGRRT